MNTKTIILAGGCFWCVEHDLRELTGVIDAVSGYGGNADFIPTYYNHKGFREVVEISYDAEKTNFKKLVQFFLDHIDPTDAGGQFGDRGDAYKTAIYYKNEEEKIIAESLLEELGASGLYDPRDGGASKPIVVDVLPEEKFFKAEAEHQNYAENNPTHYAMYRKGSGREDFVNRTCSIREEKKMNWKE